MKVFLPFFLLFLASFSFLPNDLGFDDDKDAPVIFSDQNFSQPERNFFPNQMVYVRVSAGSGDKQKTLRLLDSQKQELKRLTFSQSGNIYSVSFLVPALAGIYYVDIKIEGEGSSYAHQENFTVGEVSGGSVSAQAESQVITGGQNQGYQIEVLSTPAAVDVSPPNKAAPTILSGSEKQALLIFNRIFDFLKEIFSKLLFLTN